MGFSLILLVLVLVSRIDFLIFHTLAELFAILVAWSLFVILWNTRDLIENKALVQQILAFARQEEKKLAMMKMRPIVKEALNLLRSTIPTTIAVIPDIQRDCGPVKADPSQIHQIVMNLATNAYHAMEETGRDLRVVLKEVQLGRQDLSDPDMAPGRYACLTVADTGTGLGLATVYGIVKQNNGFIEVFSEPDQGTIFRIYLPRYASADKLPAVVHPHKPLPGGNETILLVEDEPAILRMTRMMLERKGYSVLSAATPNEAEALAKIHGGTIDLLMTDVVMPEMTGRDLADRLTVLYPDIKLLFMSGYTADVIAHHGVLDDGVAFIQKPFSMGDLVKKLPEVLDEVPGKTDSYQQYPL
jgi:CheY-like chemotaxis protein